MAYSATAVFPALVWALTSTDLHTISAAAQHASQYLLSLDAGDSLTLERIQDKGVLFSWLFWLFFTAIWYKVVVRGDCNLTV